MGTVIEFDPIRFDKLKKPATIVGSIIFATVFILMIVWFYSGTDGALQAQMHRSNQVKKQKQQERLARRLAAAAGPAPPLITTSETAIGGTSFSSQRYYTQEVQQHTLPAQQEAQPVERQQQPTSFQIDTAHQPRSTKPIPRNPFGKAGSGDGEYVQLY